MGKYEKLLAHFRAVVYNELQFEGYAIKMNHSGAGPAMGKGFPFPMIRLCL